jgi:DNA-directed RNA polymerase specialized sigma24 family protein
MNSEGYSYNEIAKEFNSNESKISNKLNYTRSKLKKDDE